MARELAELDYIRGAIGDAQEAGGDEVFISLATLNRSLRYGENPQQNPAFLFRLEGEDDPLSVPNFEVVRGNPGYVNLTDLSDSVTTLRYLAAALDLNCGDKPYMTLGVKHGNACCAAEANTKEESIANAIDGNQRAIFGGTLLTNFPIDEKEAYLISTHGIPRGELSRKLDVVIAPDITEKAFELLGRKKDALKAFINPALESLDKDSIPTGNRIRHVLGGLLVQPYNPFVPDMRHSVVLPADSPIDPERVGDRIVKSQTVEEFTERGMLLAWAIGSTTTSNTITLVDARARMLIGNGAGQQDRVSAAELAMKNAAEAGHHKWATFIRGNKSKNILPRIIYHMPENTVAYSDSFFPFEDGPLRLAEGGINSVFGLHGSVRDGEVRQAFAANNVTLHTVDNKFGRGFVKH